MGQQVNKLESAIQQYFCTLKEFQTVMKQDFIEKEQGMTHHKFDNMHSTKSILMDQVSIKDLPADKLDVISIDIALLLGHRSFSFGRLN